MLPKIIAYIEKHQPVTYGTLLERATLRGMSQDELDDILVRVHKDKRIHTTTKDNTIVYTLEKPKVAAPMPHLQWTRDNYPWPGENGVPDFIMPFPEIDMSWMFLKPDEMEEYRATMSGRPAWLQRKTKYKRQSSST